MRDKLHAFHQKYTDLVTNSLFATIDKSVRKDLKEFEKLENEIAEAVPTKWENYDQLIQFKQTTLDITERIWETFSPESFDEFAQAFVSRLETELSKFPENIRVKQSANRFVSQPDDSVLVKSFKFLKNAGFLISTAPKRVFSKTTKEELYWNHEVPVRSVLRQHLLVNLSQKIRELRDPLFIEMMRAYIDLKAWEYQCMKVDETTSSPEFLTALKKNISREKRKLKKALISISEECWVEMEKDMERVGTMELSGRFFSTDTVNDNWIQSCKKWYTREEGWINNFDVFLEDWRSDLAIHKLMLQANADLEIFIEDHAENMDEYLGEELNAIQGFIDETLAQISDDKEELSSVLKKQLYNAQKQLDQDVIPALLGKLGNKNLVNGIDRLLASTFNEMEKLTQARKVPKISTEYLSPIPSDEITTMSPSELIAFEIAPELKTKLEETKTKLSAELQENLLIAQDLDHIISFGLNTALEEISEDADLHEIEEIATTSLQRARGRAEDVKTSLQKAMDETSEKVKAAVLAYQESLNELTENENVRDMRLRILRAKALQQTEEYKAQLKGTAQNWFQRTLAWIKLKWLHVLNIRNRLTNRLMAQDSELDVEVANFLIDSEKAVDDLPVIYRNLYQIHPVSDLELFVGRESEQKKLSSAYDNWCNKKKGAAVIVGEKWSGLTSFINYAEKADLFNHPCNRYKPVTSIDAEGQLLDFLSQVVGEEKRLSWDGLVEKLKSDARRVIIVEDMQCLYLRKIGGFDTLVGLAALIHQTSGHVFWIMTSTGYAWKYLNQTISMSEAFRYEINFASPTSLELEEIIKKRNRISGYRMIFKPTASDLENKKFQKFNEEDRQRVLKDRFFKELIDFASGNISMALMFWLLSTEKVTNDEIEIAAFEKPDFSFLNKYPLPWIFGLHQLVLHDGLTLDQYALLNRISKRNASIQLLGLQEDGILLEKNDYFVLNPLIYRSVIAMLTAKNLMQK